jgi:hypothetical protein
VLTLATRRTASSRLSIVNAASQRLDTAGTDADVLQGAPETTVDEAIQKIRGSLSTAGLKSS